MCGFVGQCGRDNICDKDFLSNGINTLYHRGPDDFGFWYSDDFTVGLAHRRLSIIDLSTDGKQPIVSKSGRYIIVFNGEIYNHQDLLNELLISSEISLKGKSDTEILLNCIEIWGLNKTLKKLIGMFAIALYDKWEENIHLIRDRAGEKPLFYLIKKNTIYFASELKALLVNNQLPKKINIDALDCYLSLGYVPGEMCILDQYKKVPAASVITFNLKSCFLRKSKYWEIPKNEIKISKKNLTNEFTNSLVNQFEELLEDSVAKQMRADVPVGILLSGGIDSSLITAMAARNFKDLNTFSISFPGNKKFDESDHARLISKYFSTNHHELEAKPSSAEIIPLLIKQFDEPMVDSSMLPTYIVTNLVSKYCKVALGGDGGDELFGGYSHYKRLLKLKILNSFLPYKFGNLISPISNNLPLGFKGKNWLNSFEYDFKKGLPLIGLHFDKNARKTLFADFQGWKPVAEKIFSDNVIKNPDIVERALRTDFSNYLAEDILVKVDRTSMLNSLELRAPFLDHRIIEFAYNKVPSKMKVNLKESKIFSKYLTNKILPKEFNSQRKQGFSIPLNAWLSKGPYRDLFWDTLNSNDNLLNKDLYKETMDNQDKGYSNTERLFALVQLELWRKHFGCYL